MNELLPIPVPVALGVGMLLLVVALRRAGALPRARASARPRLCPHLGLAADPFKHYPGANDEHRCYANLGRERIDLAHQRRFCLASCYNRCPFLTVKETGLRERIWAWGRAVSPTPQAQAGIPRRPLRSPWGSPDVVGLRQLASTYGRELGHGLRELSPGLVRLMTRLAQRGPSTLQSAARRLHARHPQVRARGVAVVPVVAPLLEAPDPVAAARLELPDPVVAPLVETLDPVVAPRLETPHTVMAACLEPPDQVELVELCAPEPVQAAPEPAIRVQVSEVEVPLADEELAEYGIMALEAGDEALAYTLFRRATEQQPNDVRAWFWRAKTAESLDEVISCLERAHALEPANSQIKGNLDSAIQRREQARLRNAYTTSNQTPGPALAAPRSLRAPRLFVQLGRSVRDLMRTVTAIGAFGVGAAWLLSALPPELRQAVSAAGGLASPPVPPAAMVFAQLPMSLPVLDGYQTASAVPYGLGFLGEFIGMGLLSGDRWTRAWAPVLGLASAWLWLHAGDATVSPLVLAACVLMASGGVLVEATSTRRPGSRREPTFA